MPAQNTSGCKNHAHFVEEICEEEKEVTLFPALLKAVWISLFDIQIFHRFFFYRRKISRHGT